MVGHRSPRVFFVRGFLGIICGAVLVPRWLGVRHGDQSRLKNPYP